MICVNLSIFGEILEDVFKESELFHILEEKIYFDSSILTTCNDHMFLMIGSDLLPITGYEYDDLGTFFRRDAIQAVRCPTCKIYYDASWQSSVCPHNNKMNR